MKLTAWLPMDLEENILHLQHGFTFTGSTIHRFNHHHSKTPVNKIKDQVAQ